MGEDKIQVRWLPLSDGKGEWSASAQRLIWEIAQRFLNASPEEMRAVLLANYPWGERRYYPYKIWCREVRRFVKIAKSPRMYSRQITLEEIVAKRRADET